MVANKRSFLYEAIPDHPPAQLAWSRSAIELKQRQGALCFVPTGSASVYSVPFWRGVPGQEELRKFAGRTVSIPSEKFVRPEVVDQLVPAIELSNVLRLRGKNYHSLQETWNHVEQCASQARCRVCRIVQTNALSFVRRWGILAGSGILDKYDSEFEPLQDFLRLTFAYAYRLDLLHEAMQDQEQNGAGISGGGPSGPSVFRALYGPWVLKLARGFMRLGSSVNLEGLPPMAMGALTFRGDGGIWGFNIALRVAQHSSLMSNALRRMRSVSQDETYHLENFETWLTDFMSRAAKGEDPAVPDEFRELGRTFLHLMLTVHPDRTVEHTLAEIRAHKGEMIGWNQILGEMNLGATPWMGRLIPSWECPTLWHACFLQIFLWLEAGTGRVERCSWKKCQRPFVRRIGPGNPGRPRRWCRESCRAASKVSAKVPD